MGILQVLLSGICFGFLGYFGKMAFARGFQPGELLALRYSMAAVIVFLFLAFKNPQEIRIGKREALISWGLGVFGYAVFSSFFFFSLTGLTASLSVLLLYTYPIMVSLLAAVFLKEKLNFRKALALVLVTLGMFLLVSGGWKSDGIFYIVSGLASAFFYSIYILLSRKYLKDISAFGSSLYVQLGAGMALCLLNFHDFARPWTLVSNHFYFVFMMSFICSFLAMSLFLAGLQKLTSAETSILSTAEPISGILIASLFLGESLNSTQILSSIIILVGLVLTSL